MPYRYRRSRRWSGRSSGTASGFGGVVYGDNTFVVEGDGGSILQSGQLPPWELRFGPVIDTSAGAFAVGVSGQVGQTWQIETSTDLVNWLPLMDLAITNTPMEFIDFHATNLNQKFYRAAGE